MKHVALWQEDWTLKSVYEALFNYCFPPDFKLQLREQLTSVAQGKNDVRDFQWDLETLAVRFPDVTERQIRQIFWTGIRGYLRLYLIEKGLNPERSSIRKMVEYASRQEAVHQTLKKERRAYGTSSNVWLSGSGADVDVESSASPENDNSSRTGSESEDDSGESGSEEAAGAQEREHLTGGNSRGLLPQAEFERLRREGRCFNCKVKGHLSRNCLGVEADDTVELNAIQAQDAGSEENSEDAITWSDSSEADDDDISDGEDIQTENTVSEAEYSNEDESETECRSYEYPNDGLSDSSDEY
jgi:hypothetical protein